MKYKKHLAIYLKLIGLNEIGYRDVDLDEYYTVEVGSIAYGLYLIKKHDENQCGVIETQVYTSFGWETVVTRIVDGGEITDVYRL